jgi:hypothetical protein
MNATASGSMNRSEAMISTSRRRRIP